MSGDPATAPESCPADPIDPGPPPPARTRRRAALRRDVAGWTFVAALLLFQWVLFQQFARREIVWAYPAHHDQTAYLSLSYETHEAIRSGGLVAGLREALRTDLPNGILIHLQASLLFLVLGASRLSALTLNFLYFAALQCALASVLLWLTRRWSVALLGVGLLLTAATPFLWTGGLMDFRIDFIAFCLFGILLAAVLRSELFASRRWSFAVGAIAALLVLFRFITAVYLAGILAAFAAILAASWRRERARADARAATARRIGGLLAGGAVASVLTLPVLWLARKALYDYYVVGHLTGTEKDIRATEAGVFTSLDSLTYYLKSLAAHHAGAAFLLLCGLAVAATLPFVRGRTLGREPRIRPSLDVTLAFAFVTTSLVVPYAILTANVAKSPVVGDILVPPVLFLVLLAAARLSGADVEERPAGGQPGGAQVLPSLAAVALLLGGHTQWDQLHVQGPFSETRPEVEQILSLYDTIFERNVRSGWQRPVVSVDRIVDYFAASTMNATIYERHGVLLGARPGLGGSIFEVGIEDALETITRSDFVLISLPMFPEPARYSFDLSMARIRPRLLAACGATHELVRSFPIYGRRVLLYARKEARGG